MSEKEKGETVRTAIGVSMVFMFLTVFVMTFIVAVKIVETRRSATEQNDQLKVRIEKLENHLGPP